MRSFTHNHMATLLNLQGLIIYKVIEKENEFEVKIGQPRKPQGCKYCQSKNFRKNGKSGIRRLRHGIILTGKTLFLLWSNQRYYCRDCKRTWTKTPPEHLVQGRRRSTKDCELQGLRTLKGTSFSEAKKQSGLGYHILRRSLEENINQTSLLKLPLEGKMSIGIDEHSRAKRRYATTITLLQPEQRLIGLLPAKNNQNLKEWINQYWTMEDRKRVNEVCIDLARCWKYVIKECFPNANIVIDHFHVIQYLNRLISTEYNFSKQTMDLSSKLPSNIKNFCLTRKLYQNGKYWTKKDQGRIKQVFKLMPRVAELWYWKEEVRRIYQECQKDKEEARIRWQRVIASLDKVPTKILSENLENILNYFDYQTTNAFTEGIHTKFKLIKRYSYGLKNPDVYVKKVLLGFINTKDLINSNTY